MGRALLLVLPCVLFFICGFYLARATGAGRRTKEDREYRALVQDLRGLAWRNRDVNPELSVQIEDTIQQREREKGLT